MVTVNPGISDGYSEKALTVPAGNGVKIVYNVRHGFRRILIEGAAAIQLSLPPRIVSMWHFDASATGAAQWNDLLGGNNAIINRHVDGDTGAQLDDWAVADFVYIATHATHGGFFIDMDASAVNDNVSTMTLAYSKNDNTFAAQAITDTTITSSKTLAKDGNILLNAVPADWEELDLRSLLGDSLAPGPKAFWVRLDVSAVLTGNVEIEQVATFHRNDSIGAPTGTLLKNAVEYTIDLADDVGGLEFVAQADSATSVNVSWIRQRGRPA